ncbi:MAG: DUF2334 domain-containing protein [Verrucomicrobiota bacterium]
MKQALVSIHDVQPETFETTRSLCRTLPLDPQKTRLLIVPGAGWHKQSINSLKKLVAAGYLLAAHGWQHRINQWGSICHMIHGSFFSARAAEHLALDESGIFELMRNSARWFGDNGFPVPELYVPPAWAMGPIRKEEMAAGPFRYYETLSGIYDSHKQSLHRLPLMGYEAKRFAAAPVLRVCNAFARAWSAVRNRPARIAIHPADMELPLSETLIKDISRADKFIDCTDLPRKTRL